MRVPLHLCVVVLLASAGCAAEETATHAPRFETVAVGAESIQVPLDDRVWETAHSRADEGHAMFGWRVVEAPDARWTAQVMVLGLGSSSQPWPTLSQAMDMAREQTLTRCPGADWAVLRREPNAVMYQWNSRGCSKIDLQQQTVRIFNSKTTRFRTSITHRFTLPPREVSDQWVAWLAAIHIESR